MGWQDDLKRLRERIDTVDEGILRLLAERMALSRRIGELKAREGLGVNDPKREQEILNDRKEWARQYGLDESFVVELFRLVISESRRIQER